MNCSLPPPGWKCTRGAGHPGPCAAIPTERCAEQLERPGYHPSAVHGRQCIKLEAHAGKCLFYNISGDPLWVERKPKPMAKRVGEWTWTDQTPCPACGKPHSSTVLESGPGNRAAVCRSTGVQVSLSMPATKEELLTTVLQD